MKPFSSIFFNGKLKFLFFLSDICQNLQNELRIKYASSNYSSHPLLLTRGSGCNRGLRCNRGATGPPELGWTALFWVCRGSGSGRGTKISLRFNTGARESHLIQIICRDCLEPLVIYMKLNVSHRGWQRRKVLQTNPMNNLNEVVHPGPPLFSQQSNVSPKS